MSSVPPKRATGQALPLAALFDAAPAALVALAPDGAVLAWSSGAERLFGWSAAEVVGRPCPWPQGLAPLLERAVRGETVESALLQLAPRDGPPLLISASLSPLRSGQEGVSAVFVRAAGAAPDEGDFRAMVESLEDFVGITLHEKQRIYVSPSFLRATGYAPAEVLNNDFRALIHPDDLAAVERFFHATLAGASTRLEYRFLCKDGCYLSLEAQARPLAGPDGRIDRVLWSSRDVTERKRAEEERAALERKVQEAQRLEGLGVLAGGIAHDFNNLLTTVIGFASLAAKDLPSDSPVQPYLAQIEAAGQRAAELCQQMLAYAGKGRFHVEPADLSAVVRDTWALLHLSVSRNAVLSFRLTPDLPPILADVNQLRQIVLSLVANAAEALGAGEGLIVVATECVYVNATTVASLRHGDGTEGEHVVLEVSDTGCGMDEATLERIFEPFFTTKFPGRGLGLAALLGIVRSHKGAIQVTSAPGAGSTFRLLFPVAAPQRE